MGYKGSRRRKYTKKGGDGFSASTPTSGEAAFMIGKRKEDEAEAQRLGDLASSRKKEVIGKLEEKLGPVSTSSSRKSSTAGRRRRKTHRRRK